MSDTILGLDIGTTSTKAVLFDLSGAELASAERAYRLSTPQPGWVEQDPEEVWQALLHVLRTVMHAAHGGASPRGCSSHAGCPPLGRPRALALAAQSGSLLLARADGTPVSPIITWLDGRSQALVDRWKAEGVEARVRAVSGWHLYPGLCLPTIAWLRQHQPDVFAAARRYFSVNDFLVHRLTGRFCTNPSNAGGMQLLDVATGEWSPDLCALAGIDPGQLSPVLPSGAAVGSVTAEVSRQTGLPADTVVVNGGHDQGCTALGLGINAPGQVLLGCGTAWVLTGVTDSPDVAALPPSLDLNFHPASDLPLRVQPGRRAAARRGSTSHCEPPSFGDKDLSSRAQSGRRAAARRGSTSHCEPPSFGGEAISYDPEGKVPRGLGMNFAGAHSDSSLTDPTTRGCWTVSQSLGGLGASLQWLLQQCWAAAGPDSPARHAAFASLDTELAQTVPGSKGLFCLPLTGGHSAPAGDQRGLLWGLRLDHTRADMARAVMEGAAYELRWALEPIQQAGLPIEQLWMIGGATQSPLWPTLVADVTGLPLSLPQASRACPEPSREQEDRRSQHWPAIGAAILAGLGVGAFETLADGQRRFQRPARRLEPDPANRQIYDECFAAYQRLGGRADLPGGG